MRFDLARKPRGWTGARTPSALKRVRTAERRAEVNQPRRSAAKTLVSKAVKVATGGQAGDAVAALRDALSALDRAAKAGAIHANAAARRKSRLTRKVNAALGGERVQTAAKLTKTTGKAAAAKAAKTRIALAKADKAKGAQTAAGKARAALSKTARAEAAATAAAAAAKADTKPEAKAAVKTPAKAATRTKSPAKVAATKATAPKATAKPAAKAKATSKTSTRKSEG
jgi:ribosomal protein S20